MLPTFPHGFSSALTTAPEELQRLRPSIETALTQAMDVATAAGSTAWDFPASCPSTLAEAMRYALLAPGKRLRPCLVLLAGEAVGGGSANNAVDADVSDFDSSDAFPDHLLAPSSPVMAAAVAVEMVHAYSLIHDDLPSMDDDDLRRGRPTVHIRFDPATAILAGDALFAEAFHHLCVRISEPALAARCIGVLARAAGAGCLVGGQADDLAFEKRGQVAERNDEGAERNDETLEAIHRRKTGALFTASLVLGALAGGSLSGGACDDQIGAMSRFGQSLGLAFQVVDDLLDATATDETLGKRSGKDADRGKWTYVESLGIDGAREKAETLLIDAKNELDGFSGRTDRLIRLADYVLARTH